MKRAALYLRVSTSRQAEKDLSIPDQQKQCEDYCAAQGYSISEIYVEPGASATNDTRPALQRMMQDITSGENPADIVLVHSFSRFFRDSFEMEHYRRKLAKAGAELVSITQPISEDPSGHLIRQVLANFDEYQSRETAKHVTRSMKENARQGFWNGGHVPFGYRTIVAETRANAVKKKLDVEPKEEEVVRLAFNLYLHGDGDGPLGVKSVAACLNAKGYRQRTGKPFSNSVVHALLQRTTYIGLHYFNRKKASGKGAKDPSEWVELESPVIIDKATFDLVQARMKSNRSDVTAPRIVNGPTLLTGVAKCASCGGGMTLRTGKSGTYRYYSCNSRICKGKTICKGRSIRMEKLDEIVIDQLETKLLSSDRLEALLATLIERQRNKADNSKEREHSLRKELRTTEEKIQRLYDAVAEGLLDFSDSLRNNIAKHEQQRDEIMREFATLSRKGNRQDIQITPSKISAFGDLLKARLHDPSQKLKRAYVHHIVDQVEVDDEEIRISGSKAALAAAIASKDQGTPEGVPSLVRNWWAM